MFVQRLANHDNEFQELSARLFELLLKPAARVLENKTLLIIAPDGPLWNLPFQTLRATAGHYLIESTAISYAPSFTVLSGTFALVRYNANSRLDGSFAPEAASPPKSPSGMTRALRVWLFNQTGRLLLQGTVSTRKEARNSHWRGTTQTGALTKASVLSQQLLPVMILPLQC
jgi:CHAT domain-containing protein